MSETITIRVNKQEKKAFQELAKFKNVNLSTLIKEALNEQLEDEFDLQIIRDYEEREKNGELSFTSFDDFMKELENEDKRAKE